MHDGERLHCDARRCAGESSNYKKIAWAACELRQLQSVLTGA